MKKDTKIHQAIISQKSIHVEEFDLVYSLFKSKKRSLGRYVYSIEISVSDGNNVESNFVYDVTRLKKRAETIFHLLCENAVTPCTLCDVLEDIL